MSEPIFAMTRHRYDSYKDLWSLVSLAGFQTCFVDEINTQDDTATYIIPMLNGEWLEGFPSAKARLIWWDLEWRITDKYIPQGISEIWASDRWYAQHIGAKYVLLGSDSRLASGNLSAVPSYDYAMMAYMTGRRLHVHQSLSEQNLISAPNGWDAERDSILRSTRTVVHVHQHENIATVAPQRFALASAYRLPMITEWCEDLGLLEGTVLSVAYPLLADFTKTMLVRHSNILKEFGDILHEHLCISNTFEQCVRKALDE